MEGSLGPALDRRAGWSLDRLRAFPERLAAAPRHLDTIAIATFAFLVYLLSASREPQSLDYFVRLADAFLHGRIYLTEAPSWLNELVPKDGVYYVVYPPMPAVLLMPFVAIFGTGFHQQIASCLFGGIAVGLAWALLGRFAITAWTRLFLTAVFGFGTVLWYTTEVGSGWYISHAAAVMFMTASLNLAFERRWPWAVGFLLGCAAISRLPTGLAAPAVLAILMGIGWPLRIPEDRALAFRRTIAFGVGIGVPALVYFTYNLVRWGTFTDQGYTLIPGVLEDPIYAEHGILALEYIPRHVHAIFLRSWNYVDDAPFFQPNWWGLGLFLTTPLFLWLAKGRLRDPRVLFSVVGIAIVLVPIVTHGNVGISQFGYRFSLDFQPLLLVILATVFERGLTRLAVVAGVLSIAINAYAIWAISIGFVSY